MALSLIFAFSSFSLFSQSKDSLANYYYNQGISAFNNKDYNSAKDLLKKSLIEKESAETEYQLAIVYKADTSHAMWNISREHIKAAIKLDPENPKYHLFFGILSEDLYNYSKLEFDSIEDAIRQYKITIRLDSTNTIASEKLGNILGERFLEYNNSMNLGTDNNAIDNNASVAIPFQTFRKLGKVQTQQLYQNKMPDGYVTFDKFAGDAFDIAVPAYINAIKYDSLNPDPYLKLASLYEDHNQFEKGIPYLQKLLRIKPDNKDARLNLALLYSRSSINDSAYYEFRKAISLMDRSEREDFVYNSVKILLEPILKDKMKKYDETSLKQIIDYFWKTRDPLYLTDYNERLLEHYTRVTYANLRFSAPGLHLIGWKTDRGNIVVRYGIPEQRIRMRTNLHKASLLANTKIEPKTEIWNYNDKSFSFIDEFRNGDYILGIPGQSQYWDDSQANSEDLKKTDPEDYTPKFEGPFFPVPNIAYSLKDFNSTGKTDLYVSYGLKPDEPTTQNKDLQYKHTSGIFFFDKYYNQLAESKIEVNSINWKNKISVPDTGNLFINTRELTALPDSGNLSFEIMRDKDKGVSSYHGRFNLRSFISSSLELSDIILASQVTENSEISGRINRKNYSILPNPTGIFSKDQEMYIYYEAYNLEKNEKGFTDFQQTILLKKSDEEGVSIGKLFGSVLKFVGLKDKDQEVSLTTNYQTKDKDSQVYLQLDMSDYEPGNYTLTVKIKDNVTGKVQDSSIKLTWQ